MQIEAGKYYRDRVGRVHGPMYVGTGLKPWAAGDGPANTWTLEGFYYRAKFGGVQNECARDLILEVPPPSAKPAVSYAPAVTLTDERKGTHGDWQAQSTLFDNLMFQLTHSAQWEHMGPMRRGALTNIAQKMSRICTGNYEEPDHYDDIAGYAYLGKGGHGK